MREYLTSNFLCPTSDVTEPIPRGLGQQGQECPEQLGVSACACSTSDALVCTSQITEQGQGQIKETKCFKKIKNRMQCCSKH